MVTEEKIWEYLDGTLDQSDRQELESAIANDKSIAVLLHEVSSLHTMLGSQTAEQPSMAFTENVLCSVLPQHQYAAAPKVSILPLIISTFPFLIVLGLACTALISSGVNVFSSYHINTHFINTSFINAHFINTLKLLFVMIDGVLMILFIEQWLVARKKGLI